MRTLVVEDDYITSQVMQEILSAFGECDVAENGEQAIELFKSVQLTGVLYDVVFLDIMMPEMDGQEVLAKIREIEKMNGIMGLDGVKIVMTTALDDYENIKKAFTNQAEAYLIKPVDKDKVVKVLVDLELLS
ncbi:MAG TPA: response regulator [Candidatus Kapabacteria bacterium]|nr:response regulator [Candidatus Kapabacteria bacterium]